jgi:uncharacterized membrane protein
VLPLAVIHLVSSPKAMQIPDAVAYYADAFLELDILQFAGLAFIVMTVIRRFRVDRGDIPSNEPFVGNLVSFPFFPWFTYVLVGMFLGETLQRSVNVKVTFRRIGFIGLLIAILSLAIIVPNFVYRVGDYYHSRPGLVAFLVGNVNIICRSLDMI